MGNLKKRLIDEKLDIIQEPATDYKIYKNASSEDSEELHPILIQLIEKGKRESELGLGISNEEMKRRMTLRYPFLK